MPFASALQWVGIGKETTYGTAVPATNYLKVRNPQWTPAITMLDDQGMRGSMVTTYDQVAGIEHDEFEFTTSLYVDDFPIIMEAALGSTDTVSGTTAPYTHTIGLLNNANAGQPPSYTIGYYNGNNFRQIPGCILDSVEVKFNASGLAEATVKFIGLPSATTTAPTPTFTSNVNAVPSWSATTTLAGTAITKIEEGALSFKRGTKAIEALTGTQTPYKIWAGPLDMAGSKLTLVYEADTELTDYLSNTTFALDVKLTPAGDAVHYLEWTMTTCKFRTGKVTSGKEWISFEGDLMPLPNSTDATAGGVSPVKFVAVNGVSAAL